MEEEAAAAEAKVDDATLEESCSCAGLLALCFLWIRTRWGGRGGIADKTRGEQTASVARQ